MDAQRLKGHIAALKEAGIAWDSSRYFMISKDRKRRSEDFARLAERISHDTAFMFISDYYAAEAMNYLTDQGFRIPEDISITGFDDNILSHMVRPRLTTVRQDVAQKAEIAVKKIDDLLIGNAKEPVDIRLTTSITWGKSVKNLKAKQIPSMKTTR